MMCDKIFLKKNIIYIVGVIYFSDVIIILKKYEHFMSCEKRNMIVNFRFLRNSNTSILLLIINFIKICIKNAQTIKFINVPKFLFELSRLYNFNNILYEKKFRGYHVKRKN
jgi:ABC-type transporter Mla MlaB component